MGDPVVFRNPVLGVATPKRSKQAVLLTSHSKAFDLLGKQAGLPRLAGLDFPNRIVSHAEFPAKCLMASANQKALDEVAHDEVLADLLLKSCGYSTHGGFLLVQGC